MGLTMGLAAAGYTGVAFVDDPLPSIHQTSAERAPADSRQEGVPIMTAVANHSHMALSTM